MSSVNQMVTGLADGVYSIETTAGTYVGVIKAGRLSVVWAALIALAACSGGHYKYDMAEVEANFNACMDSTPASRNAIAFENKVDGCKRSAWATSEERFVK